MVDDESQNVDVLTRLMTRLGYEVLTAPDGESAQQSVVRDVLTLCFSTSICPASTVFECAVV